MTETSTGVAPEMEDLLEALRDVVDPELGVNVVEQAVPEKAAEGRGMVRGHSGIFVHMECGKARPIDFLRAQCGEEGIL